MSPNTRAQLIETTRMILDTYGDDPSDELLARNYECSPLDARAFWDELMPELNKKFENPGTVPGLVQPQPPWPKPPVPTKAPAKKKSHKKQAARAISQQVDKVMDKVHEPPVWVIRILAGLVSIILIVRPIGYAIDYFGRANEPWMAWGMALGLAGGAFISPQVLILGFKNRSAMTAITGLTMMVLSIWSSVQVTTSELTYLRSKTQVAFVAQDTSAQESTIKRGAAQGALDTATANLGASRAKVEMLTKKMEFLMEGTPEYWTGRSDLTKAEKSMTADKGVVDAKQAELDAIPVVVKSAGVTKEEGGKVDLGFTTDLAFAITQDVVGPLMLSMAIFLRKRPGPKTWAWQGLFKRKGVLK